MLQSPLLKMPNCTPTNMATTVLSCAHKANYRLSATYFSLMWRQTNHKSETVVNQVSNRTPYMNYALMHLLGQYYDAHHNIMWAWPEMRLRKLHIVKVP